MSSVREFINTYTVEDATQPLESEFALHFGGALNGIEVAWRLAGPRNAPVVLALGGISAGRIVFGAQANEKGWWQSVVGPECALNSNRFRILGIDFLGGSGATTGPKPGEDFPSISAFDQAQLIAKLLACLNIEKLHAIVGASYGGMVALAFAEHCPELVERIVAISAAHRTHPMATAWRSVQREIVRALSRHNDASTGLKLARALAMATYRSPQEFAERFSGPALRQGGVFRTPVEEYLFARGQAYAETFVPEAFIALSESIDLHVVAPENIRVPTTLVAVREDQLVPLEDMRNLSERLAGWHRLVELSSLYGHDAFLKESESLRRVFAEAL